MDVFARVSDGIENLRRERKRGERGGGGMGEVREGGERGGGDEG